MIKYEMVYILDARLTDGEKNEISKQIADGVVKYGGKVLDVNVWMEKQRMTFPMRKVWDGAYYLAHLEMPGSGVASLRRDLHINERVLRFQILGIPAPRKVKPAKAKAVKAPVEKV